MKTQKVKEWCTCALSSENCEMHKLVRMPSKQPQRTQTPWKITSIPSVDLWGKQSTQATVTDSKGNSIAVIGSNSLEDAAFIVRAVNSHEEMLSFLKMAWSKLHVSEQTKYDTVFMNDLAEVIAKAEGK